MFAPIARIVIYAKDVEKLAEFYRRVFEFKDVAQAKETLAARGIRLGAIHRSTNSNYCNGRDPEGNHLSIGDRGIS
jgi:hypothetical protein